MVTIIRRSAKVKYSTIGSCFESENFRAMVVRIRVNVPPIRGEE